MESCKKFCQKNPDLGLLLLRVAIGVAFIIHGYAKVSDMASTVQFFAGAGLAAFWAYLVAWVELLGGVAILVGIGSCVASALLSIVMIVAIWLMAPKFPFMGGYELPVVLLGGLLALVLTGPGKYSLGKKFDCCGVSSGNSGQDN